MQKANAASLTSVSDTLSTSRPSAAAPLSADLAASAGQAQIFDNGSFFLASDSAVILKDAANETSDVSLKVASMSATAVPSATNRIVYFTNTTGSAHHKGVALVTPVTATHQIKFTPITTIPSGGTIVITFPGSGSNTASPSATGFSFNGMTTTNPTDVKCFPTTACNNGSSIAVTGSNTITFTTSGIIAGGTTIYANIGCTTAASGPCTAFAPRLINPTKTATAGTADSWRISIQTTDTPANGSVVLDSAILKAATIESVQVQALVEPTITFTVAGLTNAQNYNTVSGAANCGSETSNSGIDSTATFVNLGLLNNAQVNRAAQSLTVSTNGSTGYVITATTSGRFINAASGQWLADGNGGNGLTANDQPVPVAVPAVNNAFFGFSPCGTNVYNVPASIWGTIGGNSISANTAKVSNPWNTGTNGFYATLTSYSAGPISNDITVVRFAAGISGTTPAGIYTTVVNYVATATF
ncbi:MAG: hypothetical protein M1444_01585 [Patescibacteria group bacterium]|nr:hypothetical protein [Patescibacteria group bacterium]